MGMGDKKIPYTPSYEPVMDDVMGKMFAACLVRSCPHPKVIEKFGVGGIANVSIYTCKRCQHHKEYKFYGGVSCNYAEP